MKKVIRLTESDLTRIVKRVINEQYNVRKDWELLSDRLEKDMTGLEFPGSLTDNQTIINYFYTNIANKSDWDNLQKAFGVRKNENLKQWLKGDLSSSEYNSLMNWINTKIKTTNLTNQRTQPGAKIRLITNREMIISRSYQYASVMSETEEILDINNATVVRKDNDGLVVKISHLNYATNDTRKTGERTKWGTLDNVCIKIPNKEMSWVDDTIQVQWYSSWVKDRVVPCK